ncbi:MAG TPA: hypothetical protein VJR89_06020 [Polyangiales bacterium]|nr:hypothetical protein [Polyangiales bacterium]
MSRNLAALVAFVLVGGLLWLVTAWPSSSDPEPVLPPPTAAESEPEPAPAPALAPATPAPPPAAQPAQTVSVEPLQPAAPQPGQPPAALKTPPGLGEQITGDQGPVAEYRALFQSEPRDSDAAEIEGKLRGSFLDSDGAPDLIKSVICKRTVCRLEMRWSMERMRPYAAGLNRANQLVELQKALSPVSAADSQGIRLVEVYLKRRATEPARDPH